MIRKLRNLYPYLFALFCASIPFTDVAKAIPNILMAVLALLFGFVVYKDDLKKLFSKSFYFLVFFIAVASFNLIFFGRWEDTKYVTNVLMLCAIIIISIPVKHHILSLKSFVISSLILLIISSVNITLFAMKSQSFDFTMGEHINVLLLGERPFLGFIYIMSCCISWFLANKTNSKRQSLFWYFISICFIAFVAVISARTALISLFVVLFGSVFYFKKQWKTSLGIIIGTLILGFLLISFNENAKSRFFILFNTNFSLSEKLAFEPRYHIWQCASSLEYTTTSFLFGRGFEQTENELVECYKTKQNFVTEDQQRWFVKNRFNTHNQYIDVFLSMGIIVFVCFISFLFFTLAKYRNNYFATSLIILIILFFFTENLVHRQLGISLVAITLVFANYMHNYDKKSA